MLKLAAQVPVHRPLCCRWFDSVQKARSSPTEEHLGVSCKRSVLGRARAMPDASGCDSKPREGWGRQVLDRQVPWACGWAGALCGMVQALFKDVTTNFPLSFYYYKIVNKYFITSCTLTMKRMEYAKLPQLTPSPSPHTSCPPSRTPANVPRSEAAVRRRRPTAANPLQVRDAPTDPSGIGT